MDGLSNRGQHSQSIDPSRPTRAADPAIADGGVVPDGISGHVDARSAPGRKKLRQADAGICLVSCRTVPPPRCKGVFIETLTVLAEPPLDWTYPSRELPFVCRPGGGVGVAIDYWLPAPDDHPGRHGRRRLGLATRPCRSARGQLGVVSGTALDAVFARRLQDGDPDGDLRRALDHFPRARRSPTACPPALLPRRAGARAGAPYRVLPHVSHERRSGSRAS